MKRNKIARAAGAVILLVALGAALWITAAAAATVVDYRAAFTGAGYRVSASGTATSHPRLHASGQALTVSKGGQQVALELIEYPSRDALLHDFAAVNGSGPTPVVATRDFDGRVLYWNENVIMALSFAPPNEPGLTRAAADIFLGRRGTGGPATTAGATTATTGTTLPATGTGGYAVDHDANGRNWLDGAGIAAALVGALLAATGVAATLRRRA
jgi:hypothetical protein